MKLKKLMNDWKEAQNKDFERQQKVAEKILKLDVADQMALATMMMTLPGYMAMKMKPQQVIEMMTVTARPKPAGSSGPS